MKIMKVVRIIAVFLLGVGLIFQVYLRSRPDVKESEGKSDTPATRNADKNLKVAKANKDLMLPDMQVSPPKQLYITNSGGVKELHFNTTFFNIGKGPLELIGESREEEGVTIATQIIDKSDGTKEEMIVGEFVFHPGHDHWHVGNYAQFQLWRYDNSGNPTEMVASTDKYSFCIWDEHPYDISLEGAPKVRQYPRCPKNIQGNSVGWGDTYRADVEGQELDITGIEDGRYLAHSIVNAENTLLESEYANNTAALYVEIIGNSIRILDNP